MSFYYNKPEYILTIAEEGSISRAAEKLYISQSTLTMYLNRVEAELGSLLFDRTVRPIKPTQAGILYINDLIAVRQMEQVFRTNLRYLRNSNETFNIGVGPIRSNIYMPELLACIREKHPDISVNLTELSDDNLSHGLFQGKHDVIFGCFDPKEIMSAQVVEIGEERMELIAPRSFQLTDGAPTTQESPFAITSKDLKYRPVVICGPGSDLHDEIVGILNRWGAEPKAVIMTQSATTAIHLVSKGLGYSFVESSFLQYTKPYLLEQIDYLTLQEDFLRNKRVCACYSKNSIKQDLVLETINYFLDIFHK